MIKTMERIVLIFSLLLVAASGFSTQPWSTATRAPVKIKTTQFMFSAEDDEGDEKGTVVSPLTEMSAEEADEDPTSTSEGSLVRDGITGEVKKVSWTDPAMEANTNPLEMSWWAYPLIGLPFVLLLNDAFHFLPTEGDGPLSFLGGL